MVAAPHGDAGGLGHALSMQRTRRDSHFHGDVRRAMRRRHEHENAGRSADLEVEPSPHAVSDHMARWEGEGGALGHTAGLRPRPLL